MSAQQQLHLAYLSECLILIAPAFVVALIRFRHILVSGALGVVTAWILVNLTRFFITIPLRESVWELEDSAPEDDSHIVGNVALLVLGWLIPLFSVLIVFLSRYLWRRFHRPSHAPNAGK
jgi:hypothetical protein